MYLILGRIKERKKEESMLKKGYLDDLLEGGYKQDDFLDKCIEQGNDKFGKMSNYILRLQPSFLKLWFVDDKELKSLYEDSKADGEIINILLDDNAYLDSDILPYSIRFGETIFNKVAYSSVMLIEDFGIQQSSQSINNIWNVLLNIVSSDASVEISDGVFRRVKSVKVDVDKREILINDVKLISDREPYIKIDFKTTEMFAHEIYTYLRSNIGIQQDNIIILDTSLLKYTNKLGGYINFMQDTLITCLTAIEDEYSSILKRYLIEGSIDRKVKSRLLDEFDIPNYIKTNKLYEDIPELHTKVTEYQRNGENAMLRVDPMVDFAYQCMERELLLVNIYRNYLGACYDN